MSNLILTKQEEQEVNENGDRLAGVLGLELDTEASPDSDGRKRWKTSYGNKTGLGLWLTIEGFLEETIANLRTRETPKSKA